jgi:hypothetical protein
VTGRTAVAPPSQPWRAMPWFSPPSRANMLVPQAWELGWTVLTQAFNDENSPGEIASALSGTTPTTTAAGSTAPAEELPSAAVSNFPSGPLLVGDRAFVNPITSTQTPLTGSTNGQVLPTNRRRCLLIVQNNSATGGATFWVAFNQPAIQNQCVGLAPGQAMVLDASCPSDSINILVTGAAGVTAGTIVEGSYTNPAGTPAAPVGYEV